MADKKAQSATSVKDLKYRYQTEIQQMMYVFGEVQDALPEVTSLVEEIVRNQVIALIANTVQIARRRASRYITVDDVIFLVRHDRGKISRLKEYLSWKDVRKNAKGDGEAGDELLEDSDDNIGKTRKKVRFNWELFSSFTDVLDDDDEEEEDEDDLEAHRDTIKRLKLADDLTRNMTKEEYMIYSDCRTASFTHRKSKRFREWTNMSTFVDAKPNDDVVDILGFLCYEMVRKITEEALQVKSEMEDTSKNEVKAGGGLFAIQASGRTPLKADHIREAFRRLQMSKNQMKVFRAGLVKTKHRFS